MTDINWSAIRALEGSQRTGFEELCAQLARAESPNSATFYRKGAPDAGVECFCVLPDGDEWGWQAKFFTSPLEDGRWQQIDRSIRRALVAHPRLKRYFICVPRDRSDARSRKRCTELDRWNKHKEKWRRWTSELGMDVEFIWWGKSEFIERLARREHAGRVEFWFGDHARFSQDWFKNRVDESIVSAGKRYTPEAHIDLSIQRRLDLFCRSNDAVNSINSLAEDLRSALKFPRLATPGDPRNQDIYGIDEIIESGLSIAGAIECLRVPADREFRISKISVSIDQLAERVDDLIESRLDDSPTPEVDGHPINRDSRSMSNLELRRRLFNLIGTMSSLHERLEESRPLLNSNLLVLTGGGGVGKTHLLCDIARKRVEAGLPTVLLMGQVFLTRDAPWVQALQHIHLVNLGPEKFLGALEAAAQATDSRAVLLVDALDEGEGDVIWPRHLSAFLELALRSPWIACILSVRSAFKDQMIPSEVQNSATTLTHPGFAGNSIEAMEEYFKHFEVTVPAAPVLNPEFENPLFLRLYCEGLGKRSSTGFVQGDFGISEVFDGLLWEVNCRLSSELDFNPDDKPVHAALAALARRAADSRSHWTRSSQAAEIVNGFLPGTGFSSSLYRALVSEGLLLEVPFRPDTVTPEKATLIAYRRFADHLIAEHFIATQVDPENPAEAFKASGRLGFLLDESGRSWHGVLESLCTQIPEKTGDEFPLLVPRLLESGPGRQAFLSSLVWRSRTSWTDSMRGPILELLCVDGDLCIDEVFDSLLMVSAVPGHPLNARFLHEILQRWSMPDRDARWSVYLHGAHRYGVGGPVERLLHWVNDLAAPLRESLAEESVDLVAMALSWMLSTSDRNVRDRATKGLVRLLTGRLPATLRLVERFRDVDDPYVLERTYAVAYGVAVRCHVAPELADLATFIYESVFSSRTPTPHVLLRDYARGVIERALYLGADLDVDVDLIRPPYQSQWPAPFDDGELDRLGQEPDSAELPLRDPRRAAGQIRFSVMSWDFGKYVIGADRRAGPWLDRRLDEEAWIAPDVRMERFKAELPEAALKALAEYQTALWKRPFTIRFTTQEDRSPESGKSIEKRSKPDSSEGEIRSAVAAVDNALERFIDLLNDAQRNQFLAIEAARDERRPGLDLKWIQKYVLWRAYGLGWTVDKFGEFDLWVNEQRSRRRIGLERIGKKYQWIAYHEALAYISDRFQFESNYSDAPGRHKYAGPWQLHCRDIDPTSSSLVHADGESSGAIETEWWRGPAVENWLTELTDREWLASKSDLCDPSEVLRVRDESGDTWLNLRAFRRQTDSPVGNSREGVSQREVWMDSTAYLIDSRKLEEFRRWTERVKRLGDLMPEPHNDSELFVGEHGWAPAYKSVFSAVDYSVETPDGGALCPVPVNPASCLYTNEAGSWDCSIKESHSFYVACQSLIDDLGLVWSGESAEFFDSQGDLAAFDPTPVGIGTNLLAREDLVRQFLRRNRLALFWTVRGEKSIFGTNWDWVGSLEYTGTYFVATPREAQIEGGLKIRIRLPKSPRD